MRWWINKSYKRIITAVRGKAYTSGFDFEDLLSDLHSKLGRAIELNSFVDTEKDEERFMAWCYVIIRNLAINESRSKERTIFNRGEDDLEGSSKFKHNQTQQPNIDIKNLDKELKEYLEKTFKYLPNHYKPIFEGYFYDGKKYEELARICKVPIGTVKTCIHRVRDLVKREFGTRYKLIIQEDQS